MRTAIQLVLALGLLSLLVAGTCGPLIDLTKRTATAGTTLAVEINAPTKAKTVAEGTIVHIEWTAANLTGQPATVALSVESRTDLTRTTLVDGLDVKGTGGSGEFSWNTHGFGGPYAIIGRIQTPTDADEVSSKELITVDRPPTFTFTAPASDVSFSTGQTLTISWTGGDDATTTAKIGLDTDSNHTSGNEIFILEKALPTPKAAADTLDWKGNDKDGKAVPPGTYTLFVTANDNVNPELIVEAAGHIAVTEQPPTNQSGGLAILEPAADLQFLSSDNPLTIKYQIKKTQDTLVDLKIDSDDDHANGNEVTILSQQFVAANTDPPPFAWPGRDAAGNAVPFGIYRLLVVASTGTGTPDTAESKGLVFRRSEASQALIALLEPSSVQTVSFGNYVNIGWRDNAPSAATIKLTVGTNTGPGTGTETTILDGRTAGQGGVNDKFAWQVPNTFAPGTYYIFAYITRTSGLGADNSSIAPAPIIIKDPAKP